MKRQEDQEEALLTRLQAERDALLVLGLGALSSQQKKRLNAVLDEREAILDRRERRRVVAKRNRKKRRKKKTPKTSSSRGRARRRQRQWHTVNAGDRGVVLLHAVFPSIVDRPEMPCTMAGMVQKDGCSGVYRLLVFLGNDFYEFLYSALSFVRKWIHALRQSTVLVKQLTYFQVCLRIQS